MRTRGWIETVSQHRPEYERGGMKPDIKMATTLVKMWDRLTRTAPLSSHPEKMNLHSLTSTTTTRLRYFGRYVYSILECDGDEAPKIFYNTRQSTPLNVRSSWFEGQSS